MQVTVTHNGSITLPTEVLKHFNIQVGDEISVSMDNNSLLLIPKHILSREEKLNQLLDMGGTGVKIVGYQSATDIKNRISEFRNND